MIIPSDTIYNAGLLMTLHIRMWSGRARISREDLPHAAREALSSATDWHTQKYLSLGSKKLIDPDALRPITAIKTRAVKMLDEFGHRFDGGWLMARDYGEESSPLSVLPALTTLRAEFTNAVQHLAQNYDSLTSAWLDGLPDTPLRDAMRAALPTADDVSQRFGFNYRAYYIQPASSAESTSAGSDLTDDILTSTCEEIAHIVETLLPPTRQVFRDDTLNPLLTVATRLEHLIPLDSTRSTSDDFRSLSHYLRAVAQLARGTQRMDQSAIASVRTLLTCVTDPRMVHQLSSIPFLAPDSLYDLYSLMQTQAEEIPATPLLTLPDTVDTLGRAAAEQPEPEPADTQPEPADTQPEQPEPEQPEPADTQPEPTTTPFTALARMFA